MRLALLTILVMIAFAANSLLARAAMAGGGIDPMSFALIRVASGAVVLLALVGNGQRLRGQVRAAPVLSLTLYLTGFSAAYLFIDAGAGALILFAAVQLAMFGGALAEGEVVPRRRWAGAALALAGLLLMLWPGSGGLPAVPALAMAAAGAGWGVYSLIGRGVGDPVAASAGAFAGAVPLVALGVLAALLLGAPPRIGAAGAGLALASGAVTSALAYALWYAILPRLGATRGALAQLTVPVIAVMGGALLLAEPPQPRTVVAAVLVIAGVAWGLSRPSVPRRG